MNLVFRREDFSSSVAAVVKAPFAAVSKFFIPNIRRLISFRAAARAFTSSGQSMRPKSKAAVLRLIVLGLLC